jgi:hypothetical protein
MISQSPPVGRRSRGSLYFERGTSTWDDESEILVREMWCYGLLFDHGCWRRDRMGLDSKALRPYEYVY